MGLHCLVFEICIKSTITGEYQGSVGSCPQVLHVRFSLVLDLTNRSGGGWVCLWEIGQWKWYIIGLMFLRVLALITAVWSFFMQYNYDQRVSWQFILVSKYGKNSTPIPGLLQNFHKSETFSDTCNSIACLQSKHQRHAVQTIRNRILMYAFYQNVQIIFKKSFLDTTCLQI